MLSILLLDTLYEEEINASELLKNAYARRELPIKRLAVFQELTQIRELPAEQLARYNVFVASFSKKMDEHIEFAQWLKRRKDHTYIVFILDKKADISACVRPSVRPSGILFVPLEKMRVFQTVHEIYVEYMRSAERETQPVFTIKTGGDYFTVNTGDISFFEAQGKKIAVKTRGQEISFYSNFDSVLEQLPDWFIRCHKGYVINTRHIAQVSFTDMTLKLKDHSVIPLSRTYRDELRTLLSVKGTSL